MKKLFDFSHFKNDLLGGVTAGIVALPLALAFGESTALGASAGLYGAILIAFFAALFGGTNTQISGPTAPMTAVSMVIIATIIGQNNGDIGQALPLILGVFLLAGVFQILLGLIKVGTYIKYVPYPVVSGFMTAIGVMILFTQIAPSLGYYPKEDTAFVQQFEQQAKSNIITQMIDKQTEEGGFITATNLSETVIDANKIAKKDITKEAQNIAKKTAGGVVGAVKYLPRALANINIIELIIALSTIVIIYGFKRITNKIPSSLVALVGVSGIAYALSLSGIITYKPIQAIPSGFPTPNFEIITKFDLLALIPYVVAAFSLSLLGAIDSLLTSVVADNMTKTKHQPNKELIGQGIGNTIAALFGGLPGAGATIRTVVNINAGGKTRLSGMIAGVLLLVILLGLGPIASQIPKAVLAGILVTVGIGVMDYKGLKAIPSMPRLEVGIMIIVLVLSVVWDLVFAVGIGLILASLIFMKKIGDLTAKKSTITPLKDTEIWEDETKFPENLREEVYVKHIHGPLFFGSTSDIKDLVKEIPDSAKCLIIRMDEVNYIDQSGLYTLEDILFELNTKKIALTMVNLQPQVRYRLENIDIIPDLVSEKQIFPTFDEGVSWVKKNVKDV